MARKAQSTKSGRLRKRKTAVAPVAEPMVAADGSATFSFGLVFDINGTAVPVSTADIAQVMEKGLDLALTNPVRLGSISDLLGWLKKNFGVEIPSLDQLPEWIKSIFDKIAEMQFTVIVFRIVVPGKTSEDKTVQFDLLIEGQFPGKPLSLPGLPIGIRGGVFGATNIPPKIEG